MSKKKKKPDAIEQILQVSEECVMRMNTRCYCRRTMKKLLKKLFGIRV